MRFMFMVKSSERSGPPPQALMDAIANLSNDAVQKGTMVLSGGLAPMALTSRVRVANGYIKVTDGPFAEAKEVIGGFAIFDLGSREEAIKNAEHFMDLHRKYWPEWEGETEIRQIFGPEDFEAACRGGAEQKVSV
jgi:hypothetical protein